MPAFVKSGQTSVDPDPGPVIDRSEVEQHPLPGKTGGQRYFPAVPHLIVESSLANAAQLALIRERHLDFSREVVLQKPFFLVAQAMIVELKFPFAVQIEPFGAFKLGARIIRPGGFVHRHVVQPPFIEKPFNKNTMYIMILQCNG